MSGPRPAEAPRQGDAPAGVDVPTRTRSALVGRLGVDAVTPLTVFLIALVGIPSRLIVGPLGAAGTPAQILGVLLAGWWVAVWVSGGLGPLGPTQPIRFAMLVFAGAIITSYIYATTRPIDSPEQHAADLGIVLLVSWAGVQFVAMDGVPSRERLDVLLRRLVYGAGALATLGILQYVTKQSFTNYLQLPGLRSNSALSGVYNRDGVTRIAGTAVHPIEFGAFLTVALPFALHFAMVDTSRSLVRRWYPVGVIAFAIPISISRSAILSTIVVLCVVTPGWSRQVRRRAYGALLLLGVTTYVLIPGLLSALSGLFIGISGDSSALSRTGSYDLAGQFIARSPVFGRGFLTFLPSYRILDNQYLGLLIDTGVVGTTAFVSLFLTAILSTRRLRKKIPMDSCTDGLSRAFSASISSATASFALFDAFSFPMACGGTLFVLGCAGAFRRIVLADDQASRCEKDLDGYPR